MFTRFSIYATTVLILVGCANNDVKYEYANSKEPDSRHAVVYIYRDSSMASAFRTAYFSIDGVEIAGLDQQSHTWVKIPAGEHKLSFKWAMDFGFKNEQAFKWEAQKKYYYRFSPSATVMGATVIHKATITERDSEEDIAETLRSSYRPAKHSPEWLAHK